MYGLRLNLGYRLKVLVLKRLMIMMEGFWFDLVWLRRFDWRVGMDWVKVRVILVLIFIFGGILLRVIGGRKEELVWDLGSDVRVVFWGLDGGFWVGMMNEMVKLWVLMKWWVSWIRGMRWFIFGVGMMII